MINVAKHFLTHGAWKDTLIGYTKRWKNIFANIAIKNFMPGLTYANTYLGCILQNPWRSFVQFATLIPAFLRNTWKPIILNTIWSSKKRSNPKKELLKALLPCIMMLYIIKNLSDWINCETFAGHGKHSFWIFIRFHWKQLCCIIIWLNISYYDWWFIYYFFIVRSKMRGVGGLVLGSLIYFSIVWRMVEGGGGCFFEVRRIKHNQNHVTKANT